MGHILVTGSSRGIGRAALAALAARGAKVIGHASRPVEVGTAAIIPADFGDPLSVEALWDRAMDIAGGEIPEESLAYLTGVHAELLQQSYGWMERKFGSVDAFLEEKAGLDAAKREAVRAALLS